MKSLIWLALAFLLGCYAVVCDLVTIASEDYRPVLLQGLASLLAAEACCAAAVLQGGVLRWIALLLGAALLFLAPDLLLRLAHAEP